MTLTELVEQLNKDLANERMHMLFYLYSASSIKGFERAELAEWLREQAQGEMEHVEEFQNWIIDLGGIPSQHVAAFPFNLKTAQEILEAALKMEQEVVSNYVTRIEQAEQLPPENKVDGRSLVIFLEDQISDSRTDAQHIKQMLAKKG